jgi:signal transduction histidine kinase
VERRFVSEALRQRGPEASSWIDRDRLLRATPFAAVAAAGQISSLWPPGPSNVGLFWISTALVLLAGILVFWPSRRRENALLIGASLYVVSVGCLMQANGGVSNGFGSLLFVAVVGVALYGRPRDSEIVVGLVALTVFCVSVLSPHELSITTRRVALLLAIAAVLSMSIHTLRRRLLESNQRTTRLLRQAESINDAARQLASLLEPSAIAALGAELAARTVSTPGAPLARARYLRIDGDRVSVEAQFGGAGESVERPHRLDPSSPLQRAATLGEPVTAAGCLAGSRATGSAIGHSVWVPVSLGGRVHGVLEVMSATGELNTESVEHCIALGHLLELALSNWAAHEELEQAGRVEERRRIARDLHDGLAHELAFIASKAHRSSATSADPDARELAGAADRALDEARRAITVLSSTAPQSLVTAVTQTAEDLGARLDLQVQLDLAADVDAPPAVTEHVLRIVREAITNSANHGHPNCVTVSLRKDDGVRLVITDDGCGFDVDSASGSGFGLLSMRERAASIGAGFVLVSAPTRGTRIEVALP